MSTPKNPIDKLYHNKKRLLIIGLTGYSSSGCKSVASILRGANKTTGKIDWTINGPNIYSEDYFSLKKLNIAKTFLDMEGDQSFRTIKISHIIFASAAFMHRKTIDDALDTMGIICDIDEADSKEIKKHLANSLRLIKKYLDVPILKLISNPLSLSKIVESLAEIQKKEEALHAWDKTTESIDNHLKGFRGKIEEVMGRKIASSIYTVIFQNLGFKIRKGIPLTIPGEPSITTDFEFIPNTIYKMACLYRLLDEKINPTGCTHIIIETLRNHHEISYLRERFSNFFVFAVHRNKAKTSDSRRQTEKVDTFLELYECGKLDSALKQYDIKNMWYQEDKKNEKLNLKEFWISDISRCIQLADVHLFNARQSDTYNDLRAQLCWYLALMRHPGLFPPNNHERVMNLAFQAKLNSGCISRQVGAAITDSNFNILSIGWNDVPQGQTPCALRSVHGCLSSSLNNRDYSQYEKGSIHNKGGFKNQLQMEYFSKSDAQLSGDIKLSEVDIVSLVEWDSSIPLAYCFKDRQNKIDGNTNQVHTRSIHAEERAMTQIDKHRIGDNAILFTTSSTCELCAKKATEMGVKEIYYVDPYPGLASVHNLSYELSPKLHQFFGAVGSGFYRLYTPAMPLKDEIELRRNKV